ncbi:MAG TPA: hypothetical protein PLQ13_07680, partial [Candidatus Krumholzibacteria bacterium]|nr:hypothetical protein [Candidatus Krumholzibacteria bacterium]
MNQNTVFVTRVTAAALAALLLLVGLVPTAVATEAAAGQAASDGYRLWLHSLERTIAGREAAGEPERNLLFPFDTPAWPPRRPRRRSIDRSSTGS